MRLKASAALTATLLSLGLPSFAHAGRNQESIFQDDNHLIYASSATVSHVLDVLASLGVDRLRVTILWKAIAPNALSRTRPHFNAADPAAYPTGTWMPYDRVLELAAQRGIAVDFNVTAPGPLWAMRHDAPTARSADHFAPSVADFQRFVQAVGTRYSGTYVPNAQGAGSSPVPRVSYWTIWNEPNIPGWLAPQSRAVDGRQVENSPRLYREYVDAAWTALKASGHTVARDTILIGELAPEGYPPLGWYTGMTPMRFLRALYCVDSSYRQLGGQRASALGCPTRGGGAAFVKSHPGLFGATGFAHHPYYFFYPPAYSAPNPDFVPLSDLGRLERGLDRIYGNYGVHRRIPIYLTEYGYQTNPPDPYQLVSPAQQAVYLNQADFMAWRDPRVRAVGQFLLYDDRPDARYTPSEFGYWDTFQTGLLYMDGSRKPAFNTYRMPIWLPSSRVRSGARLSIWGQIRPAPDNTSQSVRIEWRPSGGAFRRIATVTVPSSSAEGYFTAAVRVPGSGAVRIAWQSLTSRSASFSVG
ncbi:MAG: hypothetical protein JO086_12990 [Acidimicrobiia bacterium]|nr:hypothetical protein [Acidimicrobiia bacterium]